MKISIASDHGGVELKSKITGYLTSKGHKIMDFGTDSCASADYPDYALKAAESVASGETSLGILICKTGIGISIAANKVPGIRAALCRDREAARLSREHNDANMLALDGTMPEDRAIEIVETWLNSGFADDESSERHRRRVEKIREIEKKYSRPS